MKSAIVVGVLVSLVSVAAAKPVKPVHLSAYDANGKKIGRTQLAGPTGGSVPVRVNGTTLIVTVEKNRITGDRQLFFTSADCTGTPYVFAESNVVLESVTTVAAPGWTVYKQQPGAPEQIIMYQSVRGTEDCFAINAGEVPAFPAIPVLDLSTIFTAPFSVR